jgi:exosortase D (VPLPA-CTERM-specific)
VTSQVNNNLPAVPMSSIAAEPAPMTPAWRSAPVVILTLVAVLIAAAWDAVVWMTTDDWSREEYNHCWLIVPIAGFLLATRARQLAATPWTRSWAGVAVVVLGLLLLLLGNISSVFAISQYSIIVMFWGVVLAAIGPRAVLTIWPALLYLVFMVPLPDFLEVQLTAQLQLISSQLGVAVIRAAGLPVYLEGNVIDLGIYRLAVAEACSGLRYLFPLMSFGFLCAAIFDARPWQRALVFLSSIPLTVFMNSLRIGVIGILVNSFGIEMAEGFTHFFEGWVVFMLCVAILFAEMWLITRLAGRPFLKSLQMDTPPLAELSAAFGARPVSQTLVVAGVLVAAGAVAATSIERREEMVPAVPQLAAFPLLIGDWRGMEQRVDQEQLDALRSDATLLANYQSKTDPAPVSLWIAYYGSQRGGRSVHSPRTCLPGGGWEIEELKSVPIQGVRADGQPLPVNRTVISLEQQRQLVYYWFVQRGRLITNEYVVKWYIFWDALTRNRTDGALVRLVTYVEPGENGLARADERLQRFARELDPKLSYFLPQRDAVMRLADARQ